MDAGTPRRSCNLGWLRRTSWPGVWSVLWDQTINNIFAYFLVWRGVDPKTDNIAALRAWLHEEASACNRS
jgi:hypothetical protein